MWTARRFVIGFSLLVGILVMVMVVRTVATSAEPPEPSKPVVLRLDPAWAVERLANAVRFATIASEDGSEDPKPFVRMHRYLARAFPQTFEALESESVGAHALLLRWAGRDPGQEPILLMAHMDVVPVEIGTEDAWQYPPFSGAVADGFVWGRGTLDDKVGVLGILCAVEKLLETGFVPERTVYLAFGADEEVGGARGAASIAARLAKQGLRFEVVLDEGGIVLRDGLPGVSVPAALVGVAEKGYASVSLEVEAEGGHSSMPPEHTAVGILAAAVVRVENRPLPARLDEPTVSMLRYLAAKTPVGYRLILSNLWLFGPVVEWGMTTDPGSNALVRTTTAATVLDAGTKDNVLPAHARAVINFRLLPGETTEGVLSHVEAAVDDPRVRVTVLAGARNASAVSSMVSATFSTLSASIRAVFPGAVVAPYLVVGGTDSRHFEALATDVYRFLPVVLSSSDRARIHGTNERIAQDDFLRAIRFYAAFIGGQAG